MHPATAATARRSALTALLTAALLLAALLVAPGTARAESECLEDPAGDVEDRSNGSTTDRAEADILAVCTALTADQLEVSVRVATPTDPATDPAWADFNSAVGAAVDVDGDGAEEYDVNYGRFPDGSVKVAVFDHDTAEQLCSSTGIFDGTRYVMRVPTSCIGQPQQVSTAAFIFYSSSVADQDRAGFYDEVPTRPEFSGPYSTAPDPDTAATRIEGPSRVDTAIAVSQDDFADGAADAVVLARADTFPDALVAAPLAVGVDGPLLLTPSFALAQVVEDELQRVLPQGGTVLLSGGTAALSDDVAEEVRALGYTVERAAGPSRYATAVEVARAAVADPALIVVADGNVFPEALIGGALAAAEGGVEVLSNGDRLDDTTRAYLDEHPDAEVLALGANAAAAVPGATAITAPTPFETAVEVARQRYDAPTAVGVASGTNFPDGLTGGAHAGRRGIPLLLSWPDVLPDAVQGYLADATGLDDAFVYGGVAALSNEVEAGAAQALGS